MLRAEDTILNYKRFLLFSQLSILLHKSRRKRLYSSSRLVTLELLLLGFPLVQELARSEIAQGLVRPDSVVDTLPCQEFSVQGGYVEGEISNLIKLLCVSTLSSLNAAIELR